MVEGGVAGTPEQVSGPKATSSHESSGDRFRFTVELRPGETTIVSWKKLLKEASSSKPNVPGQSVSWEGHQQQVSHLPPPPPAVESSNQPVENEAKVKDSQDQAGTNRLSNVIEKIERMYAGNNSSEEEEVFLDDVPDDDDYDTNDSFIDDTELDDYFQVDKSTIKHDGFFVNRGKLERIEPAITINQRSKKRRRKDAASKGQSENNDVQNPNKQVKIGNKSRKSVETKPTSQSQRVTAPNSVMNGAPSEPHPLHDAEPLEKKSATQIAKNPARLSSGEGFQKNKERTQTLVSHDRNSKPKESNELRETSAQRSDDKSFRVSESHSEKQLDNVNEVGQTIIQKEKSGVVGRFDLNIPPSGSICREPQVKKVPVMPRKEVSIVRSRISMLEKAILELEKIVVESRPPSTEVQEPCNSSQTVKRRLPQDIKQKLAKVARLAQSSYGKIPMDVTSRLMSIVGHLMQLRTLKRNLKIMANLGLSAKQEKDDRLQKIKQEVADMVRQRIPYIKSKLEHQTANTDDFQETGLEEKEALKRNYSMDDALENKICDLYDLYVERLEEDSGPPVRRLYEELASMWPSGIMDTHDIKRAIYKGKDRRKALSSRRKDKEKLTHRKILAKKTETAQTHIVNPSPSTQIHDKLPPDSRNRPSPLTTGMPVSNATSSLGVSCVPSDANAPHVEKPKLERAKGSSCSSPREHPHNAVPKKKIKRKPNGESVESQLQDSEEPRKQHKQAAVVVVPPVHKPDPTPPGSDNPS